MPTAKRRKHDQPPAARRITSKPAAVAMQESQVERAVLAASLDPIITIDFSGVIRSASDSVTRVFGWTAAELVGQKVNVLMPEPHRSAHDGYLDRYHQTGATTILNRPRQFEAVRKDGSLIPIELSVSRADISGRADPLFVGLIRDLSQRHDADYGVAEGRIRTERLLSEQTAALEAAHLRLRMADRMASIGTLAAGLGHDMNNVLLPARAHLNAVASGREWTAVEKHVAAVRRSLAYLQQLSDGLHYLALDPDAEDVPGTTEIESWWKNVGGILSKAVPKHVRVAVAFPRILPPVVIAPHRLTQAVLNLVVNAGEAIPAHRKRRQGLVRVWAEAAQQATRVRLGVTDNGTGMSDEVRRRAFDLFFTTKHRGLGTGMGLALVRRILERTGGMVEIDSELERGTTVVMDLPAAVRIDTRPEQMKLAAIVSIADGRPARLIQHILEVAGVRAEFASNPGNADVWVTAPTAAALVQAKAWCARRPLRRLVLFGKPRSAAKWRMLQPEIVENCDDLESLRSALVSALASF